MYLSPHYEPDYEFQYQPSKYSKYDLYKGHNVMLRDDEDLGYLTFGNFFDIEGVEQGFPGLPRNCCLVGNVWIPLPKYSADKKKFRIKELPDYYAGAITRLVNSYLNESLTLCVALGIVEMVMDKRLAEFYKDSPIATLKTFIDISTISREERLILRSAYNHPWAYQERNDYKLDPAEEKLLNTKINARPIMCGDTKTVCYEAWEGPLPEGYEGDFDGN